jgi:hypothetical protein
MHDIKNAPAQTGDTGAANAVAKLNDDLRQHGVGGQIVITGGIASLPAGQITATVATVRAFADFGADNDPYGEHDFGSVAVGGNQVLWKIDYYDLTMAAMSPDPADPKQTLRVLTIMLASEY